MNGTHGTYLWPETQASTSVTLPCAFGGKDDGAVAMRSCESSGEWQPSPNLDQCFPEITKKLKEIEEVS